MISDFYLSWPNKFTLAILSQYLPTFGGKMLVIKHQHQYYILRYHGDCEYQNTISDQRSHETIESVTKLLSVYQLPQVTPDDIIN